MNPWLKLFLIATGLIIGFAFISEMLADVLDADWFAGTTARVIYSIIAFVLADRIVNKSPDDPEAPSP